MTRKQAGPAGRGTGAEIPELNVSAEELARMHPLVRMSIDFLNRDAVETTTRYDGQGNVISVKRKIKKSPNRARTFHSLLNAVRPLIQLEQQWLARQPQRPGYDLDGEVTGAEGSGNAKGAMTTPPFGLLYSDILSVMGYGQPAASDSSAKLNVDGSSESPPPPRGDASPNPGPAKNYYRPPRGR